MKVSMHRLFSLCSARYFKLMQEYPCSCGWRLEVRAVMPGALSSVGYRLDCTEVLGT